MRQTDSEIESVKNNPNNIERMDIGIQSLSTKMDQKKNDIRRFGCCKTTLRTVSVSDYIHISRNATGYFHHFWRQMEEFHVETEFCFFIWN